MKSVRQWCRFGIGASLSSIVCFCSWLPILRSWSFIDAGSARSIVLGSGEVLGAAWALLVGGYLFALESIRMGLEKYEPSFSLFNLNGDGPGEDYLVKVLERVRDVSVINAISRQESEFMSSFIARLRGLASTGVPRSNKIAYHHAVAREARQLRIMWSTRSRLRFWQERPEKFREILEALETIEARHRVAHLEVLRDRVVDLLSVSLGLLVGLMVVVYWPDVLMYETVVLVSPEMPRFTVKDGSAIPSGVILLFTTSNLLFLTYAGRSLLRLARHIF